MRSYWISRAQKVCFARKVGVLKARVGISSLSPMTSLNFFLDSGDLLRVGGREQNSKQS